MKKNVNGINDDEKRGWKRRGGREEGRRRERHISDHLNKPASMYVVIVKKNSFHEPVFREREMTGN
jgi:hypothetical protein